MTWHVVSLVNGRRTSQKIWGGFLYGAYRPGEWLWIDSNDKMETRHPVESYFGSKFSTICNHCRVIAVWSRKTLKSLRNFCVFGKTTPYGNFCFERFYRDTDRHVVFKFCKIWPTGNRWNRTLFTWQKKNKNFTWLSSCRYGADRAQNLPRRAPDNTF